MAAATVSIAELRADLQRESEALRECSERIQARHAARDAAPAFASGGSGGVDHGGPGGCPEGAIGSRAGEDLKK